MKALTSIRAFAYRFVVAAMIVFNRYEAGVRWGTGRSWLPGYLQDQRFDADSATREEIVRKSRYFERNNGLLNRLGDIFEQYTVGHCGLQIVPNSSEEEWNRNARTVFDEWTKFCDLTSLQSFATIQSLCARSWFFDGELFILKTYGEEKLVKGQPMRRPRIQLIESHRVATPNNPPAGAKIIDGIEVDVRGRPIAYWVLDGIDGETFKRILADQIIHIFEPSRPGQMRGLPFSYPVLNPLHDLDDLEMLEMSAAKDAAEKSTFIETPTGELSVDKLRAERYSQTSQDSTGTDTTETRTKYIKNAIGGRVAALRMGEKVTQFLSNRPTVTQQWYWDYLTSKICAGIGISKLLVYPWSIQGTVARSDLDIMAGFFRARSAVLATCFVQVWEFVIGWSIQNDLRVADPPADWRTVTVRAPRSVNVDVGRNSQAVIQELESGVRTYNDVCAELGQDWREVLEQKAKEARFIRDLADIYKLDPSEISTIQVDRPERVSTEPKEPIPTPQAA